MYLVFLTNEFLKQLKKIDSRIRKGLEKKIEEYISPQLKQEPHFEVMYLKRGDTELGALDFSILLMKQRRSSL
jgi:mRNA-degrading endonuclease RelE of RelBE toxin-antitoxin system